MRSRHAFVGLPQGGVQVRPQGLRMSLTGVKVCGIVSEQDASMVTRVFREEMPRSVQLLLGMIIWPGSKRSVDQLSARAIAKVALAAGATPVGVFVDEDSESISHACRDIGITVAQLHGPKCREAVVADPLPSDISVVDVVDVLQDGTFVDPNDLPGGQLRASWRLYDAKGGGTGRAFDWAQFVPPPGDWFLAGGLDPANVGEAVRVLRPSGLDVASGVAGPDGCGKDEQRLRDFLRAASSSSSSCV